METRARSHATEAIRAIGEGDVPLARTSIALAYEADHKIGPLVDSVYLACAEIEEDGEVTTATWDTMADAVADSDLLAVVEDARC
ncbi:MAG: hypothetical protein ACRDVL_04405 [Acidimicrobiia bacterium]